MAKGMAARMAEIGEDPCQDCIHSGRCRTDELACYAFLHFIHELDGDNERKYRAYKDEKVPSTGIYTRIFETPRKREHNYVKRS